ncbi:hypothetical protein JCM11641_004825 [Rhodosporidiobolus odoratus]
MEKFSKWRDAATGVAPFLVPLPASIHPVPPVLTAILFPLQTLKGVLGTTLVLLLLLLQTVLIDGVLLILSPFPPVYDTLSRVVNAAAFRIILAALGVLWVKAETVQLKRTGRSPPQVPFAPQKGDLIVANSSSYVDLFYLAFRYNPTFVLPVTSAAFASTGAISGFRRVSLISAVLASGKLPAQQKDGGESLEETVGKARGPVVVFPEATTSNNRALLKFAETAPRPATASAGKPVPVRVFVLAFRYATPTRFSPSLTYPVPSTTLSPLSHLYTLTSSLSPTSLSLRRLHASECPRLSLQPGGNARKEEWQALQDVLAGTGRLKRVGGLGWREKEGFLNFRRSKGR